jgi:hypothetical protein
MKLSLEQNLIVTLGVTTRSPGPSFPESIGKLKLLPTQGQDARKGTGSNLFLSQNEMAGPATDLMNANLLVAFRAPAKFTAPDFLLPWPQGHRPDSSIRQRVSESEGMIDTRRR